MLRDLIALAQFLVFIIVAVVFKLTHEQWAVIQFIQGVFMIIYAEAYKKGSK